MPIISKITLGVSPLPTSQPRRLVSDHAGEIIVPPPVNHAPTYIGSLVAKTFTTADAGTGYQYALNPRSWITEDVLPAFNDIDGDILTISVSGSSRVSIDILSGHLSIRFDTTGLTVGSYNFTIRATDPGALYAEHSFTVVVSAAAAVNACGFSPPPMISGVIAWWDASCVAENTTTGGDLLLQNVGDGSGNNNDLSQFGAQYAIYDHITPGFNGSYNDFRFTATDFGALESPVAFPMGTGNTLTIWYVGTLSQFNTGSQGRTLSYTAPGLDDTNNAGSWALYRGGSSTSLTFTRNGVSVTSITTTPSPGGHRVIVTINSSGVMTIYIDGVASATATSPGNWITGGRMNMGVSHVAPGAAWWSGMVGEAGVATSYTDPTNVAALDLALKTKWGLSDMLPTAAWSASRVVWPGYAGSFFNLTGGAVDTLYDQTSHVRNLTQATAGSRPTIVTAGPNSRAALQFDATDDVLWRAEGIRNLVTTDRGYMIATVRATSFPTNDGNGGHNSAIIVDSDQYIAMAVRSGGGTPKFIAYNYSAGDQEVTQTIAANTVYVVEWIHEGPVGNLYQRVNGGGQTVIFSGFTFGGGNFCLGGSTTHSQTFAGQIFEAITFDYVPTLSERNALVQYLGTWAGASV